VTVFDVMQIPEGLERDQAIHRWCGAVWAAFAGSRQTITALLAEYGIV
jgi:hypothetical protein